MNSPIKVLSYKTVGTKKDDRSKPMQDDFVAGEDVFIVSDGVSILHVDPYPDTSIKAVEAANREIQKTLEIDKSGISSIYSAFENASQKVGQIENISEHYGGLTTAFGFLKDNVFYFGQIGDCGVMVFDKFGSREVDFISNQTDLINHLKDIRERGTYEQDSPEEHKYVREEIVNKQFGFGVLNGDPAAKEFLHVGASDLSEGQLVLFYTDGFLAYVYNEEFVRGVFDVDSEEGLEKLILEWEQKGEKYQKDRAIVILKF